MSFPAIRRGIAGAFSNTTRLRPPCHNTVGAHSPTDPKSYLATRSPDFGDLQYISRRLEKAICPHSEGWRNRDWRGATLVFRGVRCRKNMAHVRQTRPDWCLGVQVIFFFKNPHLREAVCTERHSWEAVPVLIVVRQGKG